MFGSFPPRTLWFLAPIGIALLVLVVRGRTARVAFGLGYLCGLSFFIPLLPWVGEYVGAAPWLGLSGLQAIAFGAFGALAAYAQRLPAATWWVACAWVTTEAARARVPFGGFPWGRLAFGQADGPLLPLARVAGAPAIGFAVALLGAGLALSLSSSPLHRRWAWLGFAAVVTASVLARPPSDAPGGARIATVAAVQGNVPRLGLDFNAQRRAVLDNHVAGTQRLAADVRADRVPAPDIVIWPENSSDIDPLRNLDAAEAIGTAARAINAPILVGAVLWNADGTTRNTSIVWDPTTGPGVTHDKRQLVPFGEYLPLRPLLAPLSSYASLVGNFVPGTGDGMIVDNGIPIAVTTCYEVAFDGLAAESVRAGAQLIVVPTNNATFGRTAMTYQQLAMSRVRAVEHDRSVVVAATSGVSAMISPDGRVLEQTPMFTAANLVARVPLRTNLTPAARFGALPEGVATGVTALAVLRGWWQRPRTTSRRSCATCVASP